MIGNSNHCIRQQDSVVQITCPKPNTEFYMLELVTSAAKWVVKVTDGWRYSRFTLDSRENLRAFDMVMRTECSRKIRQILCLGLARFEPERKII